MPQVTFEARLNGGKKVITSKARADRAQLVRDLKKSLMEDPHEFSVGDMVVYKDYLDITKKFHIMMIIEILEKPIISKINDASPMNPYSNRKLDVRAIHLDILSSDDGESADANEVTFKVWPHLYEARRLRPATMEELVTKEGEALCKFADEMWSTLEKFEPGDILVPRRGCSRIDSTDMLYFLGYEEHPVCSSDVTGHNDQCGEVYDAHVLLFDGKDLSECIFPSWTLQIWDGREKDRYAQRNHPCPNRMKSVCQNDDAGADGEIDPQNRFSDKLSQLLDKFPYRVKQ